jgi:hypothetical protein
VSAALIERATQLAESSLRATERPRFEARALALVAGLTSAGAGLEVAYEHYRGSYSRRIMWTPVILSQTLAAAGVWSAISERAARSVLPVAAGLLLADGGIGFVFHLRGVARKPGGWHFPVNNVVMGPPPFAPILLGMSAYIALIAVRLHHPAGSARERDSRRQTMRRHAAVVAGISSLCSGVESLYSHYKNNFRFKIQYTPVIIAPLLGVAGFAAARRDRGAGKFLPAISALAMLDGAIGFVYHARGILRRPGGRRHLLYNIMYGPPILAPLLFAGAGFLGLLATLLGRQKSG